MSFKTKKQVSILDQDFHYCQKGDLPLRLLHKCKWFAPRPPPPATNVNDLLLDLLRRPSQNKWDQLLQIWKVQNVKKQAKLTFYD